MTVWLFAWLLFRSWALVPTADDPADSGIPRPGMWAWADIQVGASFDVPFP